MIASSAPLGDSPVFISKARFLKAVEAVGFYAKHQNYADAPMPEGDFDIEASDGQNIRNVMVVQPQPDMPAIADCGETADNAILFIAGRLCDFSVSAIEKKGDGDYIQVPAASLERIDYALAYYADTKNYVDTGSWDGDPTCITPSAIPMVLVTGGLARPDRGDIAREALEGL